MLLIKQYHLALAVVLGSYQGDAETQQGFSHEASFVLEDN